MDLLEKSVEFSKLALSVLDRAKSLGATAAEAHLSQEFGFSLTVRKGDIETLENISNKNLEITVYFTNHFGTVSTSDLSSHAIDSAIEKARYIARFTEEDPFVGLADKKLMAFSYSDLDLYHPWQIDYPDAIMLAKSCESKGLAYSKDIAQSEGVSVASFNQLNLYANSHGFLGGLERTRHEISCSFIAKSDQEKERDGYYTVAGKNSDLEDSDQVATTGARRAVMRLGARKISTRKAPVIYSAEVASSLIGNFFSAISGGNLYRNSSFLLDSLGHQIFPSNITIEENPLLLRALGSASFDDEGVKLFPNGIIASGVLTRYLLDSYSARKLKMQTTGNSGGVRNAIVRTVVQPDFNSLLKQMGTGFLVTEILGGEVNIVTGNYSRGVFGYWVEDGEIKFPVSGSTIAGNLKDIFLNIVAVGNDIDSRSNILTGSILVGEMSIAGS